MVVDQTRLANRKVDFKYLDKKFGPLSTNKIDGENFSRFLPFPLISFSKKICLLF